MRRTCLTSCWAVPLFAIQILLTMACATSPTGRSQLLMNSERQMAEMGRTAFREMKARTPRSESAEQTAYLECVAKAITSVLTPEELGPVAVDRWEVELFDDSTANAVALPGGQIGVHTGLLDVAVTPSQLATVVGHEVGHVLARHGNERVSQSMLLRSGMTAAMILVGADTPEKEQLFGLLGVGMHYGVLMPFGRTQESEADEIGLLVMARAGFDPQESFALWKNMARAADRHSPPEFLSTHPSHSTRISQLQAAMPKALELREHALATRDRPNCRPAP
jgi:predicted Zn-dependent protease